MIRFELGKETYKKMFFALWRAWDKEKITSPHEESNLTPSDSALRCSTTEPQRLHGERGLLRNSYDTRRRTEFEGMRFGYSWGLRVFSLSHARDKTKNVFLYSFNELRTYQFLISWAPGMELYELSHQCQYLSNWAPTPPLTYINPDLLWVHRWIRGGVLPPRLEFHTLPYCS